MGPFYATLSRRSAERDSLPLLLLLAAGTRPLLSPTFCLCCLGFGAEYSSHPVHETSPSHELAKPCDVIFTSRASAPARRVFGVKRVSSAIKFTLDHGQAIPAVCQLLPSRPSLETIRAWGQHLDPQVHVQSSDEGNEKEKMGVAEVVLLCQRRSHRIWIVSTA